jgi:hypothetical protein
MNDETISMNSDREERKGGSDRVILRDGKSVSVHGSENVDETVSMNKRTVAYREEEEDKTRIITANKAMAWLVEKKGRNVGMVHRLNAELTTLGRGKTNDVALVDDAISNDHAKIRREQTGFVLYDLVTGNGTFVNDQKVASCALKENDQIRLGETVLVLKVVE